MLVHHSVLPQLQHNNTLCSERTGINTKIVTMNYLMVAVMAFASCMCVSAEKPNANYTVTSEAWFEVEVRDMDGPGEDYRGRFTIGCFGEAAPMTCLNFLSIAKGYKKGKESLHYKKSPIHRIVTDFVIQMGDVTVGDGSGGKSIYGSSFNDEDFILSHNAPGVVAMANHGPDSNGSQFYVLLTKSRWLDASHVVFGKVVSGFNVMEVLNEIDSDKYTSLPKKKVMIINSGINNIEPYVLTKSQLESTEDL